MNASRPHPRQPLHSRTPANPATPALPPTPPPCPQCVHRAGERQVATPAHAKRQHPVRAQGCPSARQALVELPWATGEQNQAAEVHVRKKNRHSAEEEKRGKTPQKQVSRVRRLSYSLSKGALPRVDETAIAARTRPSAPPGGRAKPANAPPLPGSPDGLPRSALPVRHSSEDGWGR